jgi:Flp pilus assembly protein TadB
MEYKDEDGKQLYGFSVQDMKDNTQKLEGLTIWTKRFFFLVLVFGLIALIVLVYFIIKYPIFAQLVNTLIARGAV